MSEASQDKLTSERDEARAQVQKLREAVEAARVQIQGLRGAFKKVKGFVDGVIDYGALASESDAPKAFHARAVIESALAGSPSEGKPCAICEGSGIDDEYGTTCQTCKGSPAEPQPCPRCEELKGALATMASERIALVSTLMWLNQKGGLGLDVHDAIRAALAKAGATAVPREPTGESRS